MGPGHKAVKWGIGSAVHSLVQSRSCCSFGQPLIPFVISRYLLFITEYATVSMGVYLAPILDQCFSDRDIPAFIHLRVAFHHDKIG